MPPSYAHALKHKPQLINNSYDVAALRNVLLETDEHALRVNKRIGQLYCRAYDDAELDDMCTLMDDDVMFATVWGATQGLTSARVVAEEERDKLSLTFTTPLRPLTNETFVREGLATEVQRSRNLLGKYRQRKVSEYLSVVKGFVTSRTLHLEFHFNVDP